MTSKWAKDLTAGDVVIVAGRPHRITVIESYAHPTVPGAFGIARDAQGWGISLWRNQTLVVA